MTDDLEGLRGGRGKTAALVALLALLVLGAGGAAAYLALQPNHDPSRVVVLRAGAVHEAFDVQFVQAFADEIEERGFEVIVETEPVAAEGDAALAEARARAGEAEAATTVVVRIGVDDERAGVLDGQRLYRPHLVATIVPVDPTDEPVSHESEFAFEGPSALEMANLVQDTWLDTVAIDTVDALDDVGAIHAMLRGEDLGTDRMPYVLSLREGEAAIELRRERVREFEQECTVARERANEIAASEEGVTCIGEPCRPWSAVGLSPDGATAYVHEHYRAPIVPIDATVRLRWTEPPEGIYAVPLGEGEPEPRALLRVGHFYSIATMRADGSALSAAFFADRTPAVVTLDPATGEWPARWLLEARERVTRKEPSSDRQNALVYRRREGWAVLGDAEPVVMPDFDDARLVDFPDGQTRVVGVLPSHELTVIDLDGAPSDLRLPIEQRVSLLEAHDGRLDIMVREGRACAVRRFDLAARELSDPVPLPHCLGDVTSAPDGRIVGGYRHQAQGDAPGDWEIVVVDPEDGSVVALTRNGEIDEMPRVSADGSRVLWSRRIGEWPDDWDLELYRRVVCYADLPAR